MCWVILGHSNDEVSSLLTVQQDHLGARCHFAASAYLSRCGVFESSKMNAVCARQFIASRDRHTLLARARAEIFSKG